MQLGSILQGRKQWRGISTLRVICIPDDRAKSFSLEDTKDSPSPRGESKDADIKSQMERVEASLRKQLYNARITKAEVKAISVNAMRSSFSESSSHDIATELNSVIREHSADAALVLMGMPSRPSASERKSTPGAARRYLNSIEVLVQGLPPTYLVIAGEQRDVITTDI